MKRVLGKKADAQLISASLLADSPKVPGPDLVMGPLDPLDFVRHIEGQGSLVTNRISKP